MKRLVHLSVLILITGVFMVGCREAVPPGSEMPEEKGKINVRDSGPESQTPGQGSNPPGQQNDPHRFGEFEGPGESFTGGFNVNGYNLSNIRRVPHPEFIRLVFEFTPTQEGEPGVAPPAYTVSLEKGSPRVTMRLSGVIKAEAMNNKEEVIALSELIKEIDFKKLSSDKGILTLELNGPVTFQVFDLGDPARVIVVLKPENVL